MRGAAVVSLMCATLSACEPASETRSANNPPTAAPVAQSRFYAARPLWNLQDPAVLDSIERQKARAIGIVYPAFAGELPAEIAVVNDTAHEVQTVARVRFFRSPEGGWTDSLFVRDPALFAVGLERATHEDYGLPVVTRQREWARVIFAFDSTGASRQGWVRIESGRTLFQAEDSALLSFSTHFGANEPEAFFDRPAGNRVAVSTSPSANVQVLEVQSDWIRIALTIPDTAECGGDPTAKVLRRDTVWIRRLAANGRRQIVAAVAGC